eukprot:CAMPEP_0206384060 /NCGR_PEP_ID=MMETSP0294-20121207/14341_1 /ASSEMBLY_ACC=CAM_ASM_000327 /TAXON_ID=39354 /ORGANISM="Heterosigma akashiwo, Strain CCMP2393" /LENGTH=53 /DNA_ID=CAMNT_0053834281 /DNA_START=315 /DNA_END=476 /DNA_ORIENTATION=-
MPCFNDDTLDYSGSRVAREAAAEAMTNPEMLTLNQYSLPAGMVDGVGAKMEQR